MVSGTTQNLGVIGWPIAHSLSPAMQNAAIRAAGADFSYIAMPVAPERLRQAVDGLRSLGFRGFNVTIPHKTAVMELLDEVDDDARRIGAVNTVVNDEGRLVGYNTDVDGFVDGLSGTGISVAGCGAAVFGAGGAARAVLWGLLREGAASVTIGVRNPEKAQRALSDLAEPGRVTILSWESDDWRAALRNALLLVNTTPLGMTPRTEESPPVDWTCVAPSAVVYDIIYTPYRTAFLRAAETRGHKVLNGVPMLVGQGAAALTRWTGIRPSREAMEEALLAALGLADGGQG